MKQVLKNHVAILLDVSGSMNGLLDQVQKVFQNQINFLRKSSLLFEQETRVSVYTFDDTVKCLISDVDVARPMELEKLRAGSSTALLDACGMSINDLKEFPQRYGDHSFIIYLLTDGEENSSRKYNANTFKALLNGLPDNFSICALAPSINSIQYLKGYGIPEGNIDKWDTTLKGIEEVGQKFEKSMNNFYEARSKGVRSMSTVFSDLSKVTVDDVKQVAKEVKNFSIVINEDVKAIHIKPLVETKINQRYVIGKSYYELVKRETVQENKSIAVQDKKTGKVYVGLDARVLLNLPNIGSVKIDPVQSAKWNVYVQSNAVNRNIIPKQRVLVLS
jgi:uncharacterized protein YegL